MTRRLSILAFVLTLLFAATASAEPPWAEGGESRPEDLKVYLLTFGHGDDIPSWFGHTALMVRDDRLKSQRVYNYGMFSFGPDMLPKFLMGRLEFWVGEANVARTLSLYRGLNRDIRMSELNLSPDRRAKMAAFLAWNVRPENRDYLYHHYDDNCATRIRDAIDDAVDGQFKEQTSDPARFTLRGHTRRHTQRNPYIDVLLYTWMNDEIDKPILEWDEMFLPDELFDQVDKATYVNDEGEEVPLIKETKVLYEAEREPVPDEPATFWPYTLLFGLLLGGFGLWSARRYETTGARKWRVSLGLQHLVVGLLFGIPGLVLVLFHVTDHVITYLNENMLLLSPLTFMALVLFAPIMRGRRWAMNVMRICWYVMAATSLLMLLLKLLPVFDQQNWITIAMMVPFNLLMAAAMHRFGPTLEHGNLHHLADDLWVVDSTRRFLDIQLGSRMTIVRLQDGSLWLHSPIPLTDELMVMIDDLGEVKHIVGPNRFHHMHLGEWAEAYPEARLYGAPGLAKKRGDLDFHAHLSGEPDEAWADVMEQHVVAGAPMLHEVVFYHRPSKTLICTDLVENFGTSDHLPTKLYLKVMGLEHQCAVAPIIKAAFTDKAAAKKSIAEILRWDFERITLCHGDVLEQDAHEKFREGYAFLG